MRNYPNPWDSAAQGMSQGIQDYANIAGLQMRKEEAGQKTKLFNETMADIAHKNKVIGTVGGIIDTVSDLDDQGKAAAAQTLSRFGWNPGDEIKNKHLPEIQTLLKENPILTDTVNAHRVRYLDEQIKSLDPKDPASKDAAAAIEAKKARYLLGSEEARKISHTQSEEIKAKAAKKTAETKETKYPKTAEEAIAMGYPAETIKLMQKAAIEQKVAGRTPAEHETWSTGIDNEGYPIQISNRGKIMAMPGAVEQKQKGEKIKALEASVAAEEAKISAGKRDPFTTEEVETLNERSRAIDGKNRYEHKVTKKNFWSKDDTRLARTTGEEPVSTQPGTSPAKPSYTEYYNALKKANPTATDAQIKAHLKKKGIK